MLGSRYAWASRPQQPKIQTGRPMMGDTGRQPRGHPDPFPAVAARATVSLVHGDDRRKNIYEALMAIDEQIKPKLKRKKYVVIKPNNVSTFISSRPHTQMRCAAFSITSRRASKAPW